MKRTALLMLGLLMFGSMGWTDDPKPTPSLSAYLEELQVKLDHAAQRANAPSGEGSNVVGLRGSKQEPLSKQLYWKGKEGPVPLSVDEVKMFRSAIDQAQLGKKDDAAVSLKAFVDKYPKSALRPDAETTLALLSPPAVPAPKP